MNAQPESRRVAACIVCRNEADKLGPALESVRWCDETIVMDLESTDESRAVAAAAGARVISCPPVPIVELVRNDVAAAATSDWILVLDPDERVTPGLSAHLRGVRDRHDLDAIVVPRMNVDLGWPPTSPLHRYEAQLRMYRRSKVSWPTFPNALPSVPEDRVHRVPARDDLVLIHDRSRNIAEVLERMVRYAPAQGRAMADRGQAFDARTMVAALGAKAHRELILAKPWQDGVPGLLRAGILVSFHFFVWASFWHEAGARRSAADDAYVRRFGLGLRAGSVALRVSRRLTAALTSPGRRSERR